MDYQPLLQSLLYLVASIFVVFLAGIIKYLATKWSTNLDAHTSIVVQDIVGNIVAQATSFAEQWAKKTSKEIGDDHQVASSDKMKKAVEFALNELKLHGIENISEKDVRDKIESFLGIGTLNISSMEDAIKKEGFHDDPPDTFSGN